MEPVKKIVHLLFVYDGIVKPCLIVSDNRIIEIEIIEFKRTSRSEVIDRLHIGLIIQPDIFVFRCIDNRIVAYNVLLTDGDTLFHSAHSLEKTPIPHIYYRVDHRKSLVGKKDVDMYSTKYYTTNSKKYFTSRIPKNTWIVNCLKKCKSCYYALRKDYIMYKPENKEEETFLAEYNADKYPKPSVTLDIVIFTLDEKNELNVLLIKRKGFPYKDHWAIPGGFLNMDESIDEGAARELEEETGLQGIHIEQFQTFGEVDRDPRMRVISIAYMAFVPKSKLNLVAGDDAADAQLFKITHDLNGFVLIGERNVVKEKEFAFDHAEVLRTALMRLRNRIDYTEDAFDFLKNDQSFTMYELRKIFETVKGKAIDAGNFRKEFINKYINTGLVVETGETVVEKGRKAAKAFKRKK